MPSSFGCDGSTLCMGFFTLFCCDRIKENKENMIKPMHTRCVPFLLEVILYQDLRTLRKETTKYSYHFHPCLTVGDEILLSTRSSKDNYHSFRSPAIWVIFRVLVWDLKIITTTNKNNLLIRINITFNSYLSTQILYTSSELLLSSPN